MNDPRAKKSCPLESGCPHLHQGAADDLSRRRFLKIFTFGAVLAGMAAPPFLKLALADDAPDTAVFKIKISDYPDLADAYGSVRLGVNPVRVDDMEPYPDGDFYPIIVTRGELNNFYVLDSYCQHQGCVVPPFDYLSKKIKCVCHGSEYAIDGQIILGPTEFPLNRWQAEYDGNNTLTIHAPYLGFPFKAVPAASTNPRFKLTFETHFNVRYEVYYRASLASAWALVPFSTTVNGAANQTVFNAISLPATLYVDRPSTQGFFAVAMQLKEV